MVKAVKHIGPSMFGCYLTCSRQSIVSFATPFCWEGKSIFLWAVHGFGITFLLAVSASGGTSNSNDSQFAVVLEENIITSDKIAFSSLHLPDQKLLWYVTDCWSKVLERGNTIVVKKHLNFSLVQI